MEEKYEMKNVTTPALANEKVEFTVISHSFGVSGKLNISR
jgi:hypothetical protein